MDPRPGQAPDWAAARRGEASAPTVPAAVSPRIARRFMVLLPIQTLSAPDDRGTGIQALIAAGHPAQIRASQASCRGPTAGRGVRIG